MLGEMIGRYRIARLLGAGGMGRVYLGVQPTINSRVAIKILTDTANPELIERLFAEAYAVNVIRHENIIDVLDHDRLPDGRAYLVMEYVDGQTLRAMMASGPTPLAGVVAVMSEVLLALAAAHEAGIVHRDLKPENIMVSTMGRTKVLDFGIAKLNGPDGAARRTRTGALLGTPAYMAPEQIVGDAVDARSDVYSAGIVLYEATTGHHPFDDASDYRVMRAHVEREPRAPREHRPELPVALEAVILRALAKRPVDRYPDAKAMVDALADVSATLPAAPELWRPSAPPRDPSAVTGRDERPGPAAPAMQRATVHDRPGTPRAARQRRSDAAPSPARGRRGAVVGIGIAALVGIGALAISARRHAAATSPPVVDAPSPDRAPAVEDAAVAVAVDAVALIDAGTAEVPRDARAPTATTHVARPPRDAGGPPVDAAAPVTVVPAAVDAAAAPAAGCVHHGIKLWGRVKRVDFGADLKIKLVRSFADLHVKVVDTLPDACGRWKWVDDFPDFTVEFVDAFSDMTIKYVDTFPGRPR